MDSPTDLTLRRALAAVLAFAALNAFGGGWYGLSGAPGVPVEWLEGSPFTSYFVPSLVLMFVVGGASLVAAFAIVARLPAGRALALAAGAILTGWIAVQVAIIGYVSWMQPATLCAAAIVLALAWHVPRSNPARDLLQRNP